MKKNRTLDCISAEDIFMIDGEDIVLREFRLEDLDELYALTLQPEITDYLPDWIGTREQYEDWMVNIYKEKQGVFKSYSKC